MYAGRGIVHSERPDVELVKKGGTMEIIQIWVNVPKQNKMDQPSYHPLTAEETPELYPNNRGKSLKLVAGKLEDQNGPIPVHSDLIMARIELSARESMELPLPEDFNAALYNLSGEAILNRNTEIGDKQLAWFENSGEGFEIEAKDNIQAILLAGKPIDQEVVSHGPFVMNSTTEIMEAMRDYQMGKMGFLVEDFLGNPLFFLTS